MTHPDAYKVAARIKAWMELKEIQFFDLPAYDLSVEEFDDFMEDSCAGIVRNTAFVERVRLALEIDSEYLLRGRIPPSLPWPRRRLLMAAEAYQEFYSRGRGLGDHRVHTLSRFVQERLPAIRRQLSEGGRAAFKDDPPSSVSEVDAEFRMWLRSKGNRSWN